MHLSIELAQTTGASQPALADQRQMDEVDDKAGYLKVTTEVSSISEHASRFRATSPDDGERYLPPKPLKPLTNPQLCRLFAVIIFVLAMTIGVLKLLAFASSIDIFMVPDLSQDCGGNSVPAAEKGFYINWQVLTGLSFARAKLLDLAWDTVLGQGGKFLHSWILYRVVASQITWMMEYSSVPYHFQLDLLFSTVSVSAIVSSLRFLSMRRPIRAVLTAVWLILAISYILAFSSIWGAATGYLNPSTPAYRMADQSYVTIDSETLQLCWSVDDERLNGSVPAVITGPRLGACFDTFSNIEGGNLAGCDFTDGSDDWKNLLAYYQTKTTIQSSFALASSHDVVDNTTDFDHWDYYPHVEFWGLLFSDDNVFEGLYQEFTGFQFAGVGQGSEAPYFKSSFQLDTSIDMSDWGEYTYMDPVPYNSTLWFNDSAIALDAPFLGLPANENTCGWFTDYGPGVCACYMGSLLETDFRQDAKRICISEEGYVWGFSIMITLICIVLEACWVLGCFGMWLDVHINSVLFRMDRRGSGVVRSILDVANAIQRDLGHDTGAYKDEELKKALDECPPVGFEIDDSSEVNRIAIVSMPGTRRRRSQPKITPNILYA